MEKTVIRGVEIDGLQLLHPSFIPILDFMLEHEPERKLERIIIKNEGGPKGLFGKYFPELAIFIINLEHIFDYAVKQAKDSTGEILSITAHIWMNLIWAFSHELHHAVAFATDDSGMLEDEEYLKLEDEEADAYGDEMLKTVARLNLNIEPPVLGEMPFFGLKVMEMVIAAFKNNEDWGKTQQDMITKGYAFAGINFELASLREYIRMANNNPDWEETTEKVTIEEPKAMVAGVTTEMVGGPVEVYDLGLLKPAEPAQAEEIAAVANAVLPIPDAPTGHNVEAFIGPAEMLYEGDIEDVDACAGGISGEEYAVEDPVDQTTVTTEIPVGATVVNQPTSQAGGAVASPAPHPSFAQTASQTAMNDPGVQVAHEVYKKVIRHLFDKVWDPRGLWKDGNALWTPIDITDIQGAPQIIMAYATNMQNRRQELPANGKIVGRTFKNHTLPGYDITIAIGGSGFKRRLIVQNPFKMSQYAAQAQAGHEIVWIIDIATNEWKGSYRDGVWHPN